MRETVDITVHGVKNNSIYCFRRRRLIFMKCQICHKNEAHIVFTQIVNNEKIVIQICTECARKKGLSIEFHTAETTKHDSVLFGEDSEKANEKAEEPVPDISCEACGLTFAEFKKTGLFGCDKCHESFNDFLTPIIKQIHGVEEHKPEGQVPVIQRPKHVSMKRALKLLKDELVKCVEIEDYEKAAELRDKIAAIEKEQAGNDF